MNRTIYNLLQYLRRNPDLYTAAILAFVTSFFIRFSITSTIDALNLKILLLLLCLMLVVASFKKLGVLSLVYMKLCSLSGNARSLSRLFISDQLQDQDSGLPSNQPAIPNPTHQRAYCP